MKIKLISYLFVVQVDLIYIAYISTNLLNFGCSLHKAVKQSSYIFLVILCLGCHWFSCQILFTSTFATTTTIFYWCKPQLHLFLAEREHLFSVTLSLLLMGFHKLALEQVPGSKTVRLPFCLLFLYLSWDGLRRKNSVLPPLCAQAVKRVLAYWHCRFHFCF